jgi:hypothetical protein
MRSGLEEKFSPWKGKITMRRRKILPMRGNFRLRLVEVLPEEGRGPAEREGEGPRDYDIVPRRSEEKGKPTVDNHYYISNRGLDAEEAAPRLLRKTAVPEKRFSVQGKTVRAAFSDEFPYRALFG